MPKKKEHAGIISCDPSFRHCSWTLYCPSLSGYKTKVYDITQDYKAYDRQDILVRLIAEHLDRLFQDFAPFIEEISVFVIEGQYKTAMIRLKDAIVNQMYARIRDLKLVIVPAYTWRNHFSIGGESYYWRKKASVKFVADNPQLLCWLPGIKDDNMAESIILLNFAVQKHGLQFYTPTKMDYNDDDDATTVTCGTCSAACVQAMAKSGRAYWKCENRSDCSKASTGGFACFVGEENKPKPWEKKNGGYPQKAQPKYVQKRTLAPPTPSREEPKAKKQRTTASQQQQEGTRTDMLLSLMIENMKSLHEEIVTHTKLLASMTRPSYSDAVDTLFAPDEQLDSDDESQHGISDYYDTEPPAKMPTIKGK